MQPVNPLWETIKDYDWSRVLIIGGLATLDLQEVADHMNALVRIIGRNPKCVVHCPGQGASPRVVNWSVNNGVKHAPIKTRLNKYSIEDLFSRGKPTAVLLFPGVTVIGQICLVQAKKRGLPIVEVDSLHETISNHEIRKMALSVTPDRVGKPVWKETMLFGKSTSSVWKNAEAQWLKVFRGGEE